MLKHRTPDELSFLATSFATAISNGLDVHAMRVLCSFFTSVVAILNLKINQQILLDRERDYCRDYWKRRDEEYKRAHERYKEYEHHEHHEHKHKEKETHDDEKE